MKQYNVWIVVEEIDEEADSYVTLTENKILQTSVMDDALLLHSYISHTFGHGITKQVIKTSFEIENDAMADSGESLTKFEREINNLPDGNYKIIVLKGE